MGEIKYYTEEGLNALKEELNQLETKERIKVAQAIAEARDKGDLSENAEYDAAKEEQRHMEARIAELEAILKNVAVVDTEEIDEDAVNVGHSVKVFNENRGIEQTYHIVGSSEANALKGLISNESPIGKALLGHRVGDSVTAEAPVGEIRFRILDIQRT